MDRSHSFNEIVTAIQPALLDMKLAGLDIELYKNEKEEIRFKINAIPASVYGKPLSVEQIIEREAKRAIKKPSEQILLPKSDKKEIVMAHKDDADDKVMILVNLGFSRPMQLRKIQEDTPLRFEKMYQSIKYMLLCNPSSKKWVGATIGSYIKNDKFLTTDEEEKDFARTGFVPNTLQRKEKIEYAPINQDEAEEENEKRRIAFEKQDAEFRAEEEQQKNYVQTTQDRDLIKQMKMLIGMVPDENAQIEIKLNETNNNIRTYEESSAADTVEINLDLSDYKNKISTISEEIKKDRINKEWNICAKYKEIEMFRELGDVNNSHKMLFSDAYQENDLNIIYEDDNMLDIMYCFLVLKTYNKYIDKEGVAKFNSLAGKISK